MNPNLIALTGDVRIAEKLETYFQTIEELPEADDLGLLDMMKSIEQTEEFRSFHPVVRELKGFILDDAGTSNHHVFIGQSPLVGAVLHLSHDGDSRVVFACVESFMQAAKRAAADEAEIEDEHPEHAWVANDQAKLKELISSLRASPDSEDILTVLVPSLELSDIDFLTSLMEEDGFYIAEAVCNEIVLRPKAHLLPIARKGEEHPHPVVREAAAKARERIATL